MKQAKKITSRARKPRKNATDAENCLWQLLRHRRFLNYRFRRQHPIGVFVADFACIGKKLIIEVDGGQHANNPADAVRTKILQQQGWKILRFWNNDVLSNSEGVMLMVENALLGNGA